jgi:maltose O-acetyltransferase
MYRPGDKQLISERMNARRLTRLFNATTNEEWDKRSELMKELLGQRAKTS